MNKQEFLAQLRRGLRGLPREDVEERLTFYGEMIDDRVEDGLSEAEAVAEIGNVKDIVSQILSDTPITRLVKEKIRPKSPIRPWVIVLLILGFPLWLPLLISVISIVLAAYIIVWAVIISFWAAFVSVAAGALGGVVSAIYFVIRGRALTALSMLAVGLLCAGTAILMFFVCLAVTKGAIWLTKKAAVGLKHMLVGKEAS